MALIAKIPRAAVPRPPPLPTTNFLLGPLALAFLLALFDGTPPRAYRAPIILRSYSYLTIKTVDKVIAIIGLLRVRYSSKVEIAY